MNAPALVLKFQKLYLCRYGFNGATQVCLFLGYQESDGYLVRKWQANSGRWTKPMAIAPRDLLRAASKADCQKYAVDVGRL